MIAQEHYFSWGYSDASIAGAEAIPHGKIPNDAHWSCGMTHRDGDHSVDAANDATVVSLSVADTAGPLSWMAAGTIQHGSSGTVVSQWPPN